MALSAATRAAIERAASEEGIDPAAALAIAERESNFNPQARSSKTIRGLFQMRGDLRRQHGIGDSNDPYTQAKGWGGFFNGVKREMAGGLGRDPTDAEGYLGHHFGARRAARMMQMDPSTPVDQVFTKQEMRLNPHFGRAGTVGELNSSIIADIGARQAKFGGDAPDFAGLGNPVGTDNGSATSQPTMAAATSAPDFSSFGVVADTPTYQHSAPAASSAPDFSNFGTPA